MSRRNGETIKQHDLRKIDEEARRLSNYKARKILFANEPNILDEDGESLPSHVMQDLAFCRAMVAVGYVLRELDNQGGTE